MANLGVISSKEAKRQSTGGIIPTSTFTKIPRITTMILSISIKTKIQNIK